jgi:hypothetical protein
MSISEYQGINDVRQDWGEVTAAREEREGLGVAWGLHAGPARLPTA